MLNKKDKEYSKAIAKRFRQIMIMTDLDISGFAAFVGKSEPHIYGILNCSRDLSEVFARKIGERFEFDGAKIFNINLSIPQNISKSKILIKFRAENKDNFEYFLSTKSKRSINKFIMEVLINSTCFDDGYKYLKDVKEFCLTDLNREFIGDELTKGLQYAVEIEGLKSIKKPILKKNGEEGKRLVDVYFK